MRRVPHDQLAVVSQSGPTVTFFDAAAHEPLEVLEVPGEPHELCFDPRRRLLYCTVTYRSGYYHAHTGRARELVVIDPDAHRVVEVLDLSPEEAPHGVLTDPVRDLLWVSVEGEPGALVAVDPVTRRTVRRIPVGAPGPHWFVLTPDGRHAYTSNKEAPFVTVVDLATGREEDRVPVPGSEGIAVSPDGGHVYVAAPKGDFGAAPAVRGAGVRVIDTRTRRVVRTLPADGLVFPVHVTSRGRVLAGELRFAAAGPRPGGSGLGAQAPGLLRVHAPDRGHAPAAVPVGAFPLTIASSPDGRYGYVSAVVSSTVTVVDLEALEAVAVLEVPRAGEPGAHGLAYVPAR
ncbi:YncE family protein [Streptomyces sp. MRC013]|uniref:YncE family protein n=1 Tax=Streptomyces sp. MRC013 TaxID=2898276 RepID=UPI002026DAA5|nr:YncE family protein [Streptomyces sp. MRC013]URM92477.1 YncE family protein [Streptomyces sp. MRC013]